MKWCVGFYSDWLHISKLLSMIHHFQQPGWCWMWKSVLCSHRSVQIFIVSKCIAANMGCSSCSPDEAINNRTVKSYCSEAEIQVPLRNELFSCIGSVDSMEMSRDGRLYRSQYCMFAMLMLGLLNKWLVSWTAFLNILYLYNNTFCTGSWRSNLMVCLHVNRNLSSCATVSDFVTFFFV